MKSPSSHSSLVLLQTAETQTITGNSLSGSDAEKDENDRRKANYNKRAAEKISSASSATVVETNHQYHVVGGTDVRFGSLAAAIDFSTATVDANAASDETTSEIFMRCDSPISESKCACVFLIRI